MRAYDAATAAETGPQLRRVQERIGREKPTVGDVRPVIFVVGSVSGGSGSGMLLDVVDVLRAHGHREINAVVFTEVFEKASRRDRAWCRSQHLHGAQRDLQQYVDPRSG